MTPSASTVDPVRRVGDADAASVLGLGYPKQAGGVLRAVEDLGLDAFVALCDKLAGTHGNRFAPSPWLRDLAARDRGFLAFREEGSRILAAGERERKPCD